MGWKKGQSGNPGGRPFGSDKLFAQALRMEILSAGQDLKELRAVARALLDQAKNGDIRAISELADRIDGRPATVIDTPAIASGERRKLTYEIVHTYEERPEQPEQLEPERGKDLLVDYSEIKSDGNGHGESENKAVNGNGHEQRE